MPSSWDRADCAIAVLSSSLNRRFHYFAQDVCKEAGAEDRFKRIGEAYEVRSPGLVVALAGSIERCPC